MSILDHPDQFAALDPGAMTRLIESFPAQMEGAAQVARTLTLPLPSRVDNIVVAGMGGSAIGGDVIRVAASSLLRVPFLVCRDYRLPTFVGPSTLVFASSYSGNTEETLACYEQARAARAHIVCLTSGGKLASSAYANQHPVIQLPSGLPPRAALGYSAVLLLGGLTVLGQLPDLTDSVMETINVLKELVDRYGPALPVHKNRAKMIAHTLHGRLAAIYASSSVLEPAAVRWRGQLAENAKNLSFHHVLPEMNHNEIVGWEMASQNIQSIAVILLRDRDDHPLVQNRFDLTRDIIAHKASPLYEVWSEGESPLARVFSVICLGDFISLYLAYLNSVDPTSVRVIDELKKGLVNG